VVINYLHLLRRAVTPNKADPPLIINPDAVLTLSLAAQSLESVSGYDSQILQCRGIIEHSKLPPCHPSDVPEPAILFAPEQILGLLRAEGPDHE
jgi:hypothetical protein